MNLEFGITSCSKLEFWHAWLAQLADEDSYIIMANVPFRLQLIDRKLDGFHSSMCRNHQPGRGVEREPDLAWHLSVQKNIVGLPDGSFVVSLLLFFNVSFIANLKHHLDHAPTVPWRNAHLATLEYLLAFPNEADFHPRVFCRN
jgi:hypothetical protein